MVFALITSIATAAIAMVATQVSIAVKKVIQNHLYIEFNIIFYLLIPVPSNEITPPMISQPPETTETRLGDPSHLNCTAEGHPAPSYQWYKDGVLIPDEIESVLYIPEPSPEDRGNYTCRAINSEGETDESKPAKLDIAGMKNDAEMMLDHAYAT